MMLKRVEVVAAVISSGGRIFATQRGYGEWKDWWEFPGGKVEAGETPQQALVREIREELSAEITIGSFLHTVEWDYPSFHLTMHCYMCSLVGDGLVLMEHEAARWLSYCELWDVRWLPADEGLLPLIAARLIDVDASLAEFIESSIVPRYAGFDKAHREDHARSVILRALDLARFYPVSRSIVYAAAACHDLGLVAGREVHHLESGRIIRAMPELRRWFTADEIELIAQAAEDHRASAAGEPRSIYGRIVAEADRLIEPIQIIRRTVQYGLSHYPDLSREEHWQRTLDHLQEKYAEGGYLKLWIPESPNAAQLSALRLIIADRVELRGVFDRVWEEERG
ncbi:MAG: NUDIX domain-containing protein [Bacteroidales bacterium]|nr:NUDIX domain-containing protein [Bacteroidales bacterium]